MKLVILIMLTVILSLVGRLISLEYRIQDIGVTGYGERELLYNTEGLELVTDYKGTQDTEFYKVKVK